MLASEVDEGIILWDVTTASRLRMIEGVSLPSSVSFSKDGKLMAATSFMTVRLWEMPTGRELRLFESTFNDADLVAFGPDGETLLSGSTFSEAPAGIVSGNLRAIRLWPTSSSQGPRSLGDLHGVLSPNLGKIAGGGYGDSIEIWDVPTGQRERVLAAGTAGAVPFAFSSDAKILATGVSCAPTPTPTAPIKDNSGACDATPLKLWDVDSGKELFTMRGHYDKGESIEGVHSAAFSPDGKILASDDFNKIILWDVASGRELRRLGDYWGRYPLPQFFAFSHDGKLIVGNSTNGIGLWDVNSGEHLKDFGERGSLTGVAFGPGDRLLAVATESKTIELWDVATLRKLKTLRGHTDLVRSVNFSPDDRLLVSGSWDSTIKLWDVQSGEEVASLLSIGRDDWLVITPDGLFDGSPPALKKIFWRFSPDPSDILPVEAFFGEFYYPGLLADLLSGKRPRPPGNIAQKDRRQPVLALSVEVGQAAAGEPARTATVKIRVEEKGRDANHKAGSGARDVRLFRNGLLVKVWRGDVLNGRSTTTLEETVTLVAGENRITAYAFNSDNFKSDDFVSTVAGDERLARKGTLYVLAVGVNQYSNPNYDLRYATADAGEFGAEVVRQQLEVLPAGFRRYARAEVVELFDAQASRENILRALARLAGQDTSVPPADDPLAALKPAQPEDAVIVFFAGHGKAASVEGAPASEQGRFYLIPHDMGYAGPRVKLAGDALEEVKRHAISDRDLEAAFQNLDAGQLVLVIDACNSGEALESEEWRRGPMNSRGLAQLAYEKGMYVLTASQGYESAKESARLGHGFLTYALVEDGLRGGHADREPKDGEILLREWLDYAVWRVPQMQAEKEAQCRADVECTSPDRQKLVAQLAAQKTGQRPRVFYRRESDLSQLVVAVH